MHTYMHTYTHTCMHACVRACMHAYIHTHACLFAHTSKATVRPQFHDKTSPATNIATWLLQHVFFSSPAQLAKGMLKGCERHAKGMHSEYDIGCTLEK